jgi:hypothetical protein
MSCSIYLTYQSPLLYSLAFGSASPAEVDRGVAVEWMAWKRVRKKAEVIVTRMLKF